MKNRLARSFMCSVIEPDTSIRQNITAWAMGFGIGLEAAVAQIEGVEIGRPALALPQGRQTLALAPQPRPVPGLELRRSPLRGSRSRCALGRRMAMRRARRIPHRPVQRDVGGRAGHGVAGAPQPLRLRHRQPALGEVGQFEVVEEDVEEFLARQHEAELVLAAAALAGPGAAAALARFRALDPVALVVDPCCPAGCSRACRRSTGAAG